MFISVIVCTYNRDKHISRALESLTNQDCDKNAYEIIVVDNNSTDNTFKIINNFKERNPAYNITVTTEKNQGLSFARNKGIKLAKGDYISFIDDDGIARDDYIKQIKFYTKEFPEIYAFGGKVIPKYETGKEPEWMSKYIERIISIVDLGDDVKILKKLYPVGCNMIFKKKIFEKIGGFNTHLRLRSDDKYIFLKIRASGYKVLYLPNVTVQHFIDRFRVEKNYIVRVSLLNGKSENIRIKTLRNSNKLEIFIRFIDYLFKVFASLVLWLYFIVKGQSVKGEMLFISLWNQLKAFIFPNTVEEYN